MGEMSKQCIRTLQLRLKYLDYYHVIVDGEEGPATRNAVTAFKGRNGLTPRPLVGPLTLTKMFDVGAIKGAKPKPVDGEPPWLTHARSLLGTKEVRGKGNNPEIMAWADEIDLAWYPGDDIPWCGLFVAICMHVGAPHEPQEHFNRLGARAWRDYGVAIDPCVGAIGRFWRTHKTQSVNGHVAFIIGEGSDYYVILGGNQTDNVTITKIAKTRLLDCRAPSGWQGEKLPPLTVAGALSQNEA